MCDKFELRGSIVPLISPLTKSEDLDVPAVKRLISFHRGNGTDALFLLGTCGEGPCLTDKTKDILLDAVIGERRGIPVLVCITETGTKRAVAWVKKVQRRNISAFVIIPPIFQFPMNAEEHIAYIRAIADAVDIPLVVYNIPQKCGNQNIPIEAVRVLAADNIIMGIKDSSGDLDYISELLRIKDEVPSFRVMNGEIKTAKQALEMGVDGLVMSYTNVDPAGCVKLVDAVRSGDKRRSEELQEKFIAVWGFFPEYATPAARTKAILAAKGLCEPYCCAPSTTLKPIIPAALKES